MPLYCVNGICAELDRLPSEEQAEELRREAAREQSAEQTRRALTRARQVGEFERRPPLRPGESPR